MKNKQNVVVDKKSLLTAMHDSILVVTIDRQESYNSWTTELRSEIAETLRAADIDSSVEGVVITGAGPRAFCAGQDLNDLQRFADGTKIEEFLQLLTQCYDAVRAFGKPLVAAVNGVAAGSGFQLTQFCDYVVAHDKVRVGQTEVNSGLPSVFGTWLMAERIGSRANELALQGRIMYADEALSLGFIHKIVSADRVVAEAVDAAKRLAEQPRVAYRMSKAAIRAMDQEKYTAVMRMAISTYIEAFNTGAPQAEINRFFQRRAKKEASAAIS